MVSGIDKFVEKFKDYSDCYTIIGGAACDILMGELSRDFRATKDIDMILIMEGRSEEFTKLFWEFIKDGGYKCGWKNDNEPHFYRFTEPVAGYPVQIELFSRLPDYHLESITPIIPIYISDDISSLSAILLNDDYYRLMLDGKKVVNGVSVLGAEYLVPFKMFAWMNLLEMKNQGQHVNERDLRKHKLDVFRLLEIVEAGTVVSIPDAIASDVKRFVETVALEQLDHSLNQIGVEITQSQGIDLIKTIYLQQ